MIQDLGTGQSTESTQGQSAQGSSSSTTNQQASAQLNKGASGVSQPHQTINQPSGSSPTHPMNSHLQGSTANIKNGYSKQLVILMVKKGMEHRLAQIGVSGHTCQTFFSAMKVEYLSLRGFWRKWLSVWRYSHCDFYKVS